MGRLNGKRAIVALDEFGGLDVVYANAGISGGMVPLFEQTVEHWLEIETGMTKPGGLSATHPFRRPRP